MPGFTESNITLEFPDTQFFRFQDCPGYQKLSGYHFKEMDACWVDKNTNTLWVIELKDFSLATGLNKAATIEEKTWELVKKAVDSLVMLLSIRHQYPYGVQDFAPCLPNGISSEHMQTYKLITIIKCSSSQEADVQLINNSFKSKFKAYAQLFGINSYTVLSHASAQRQLSHFVR
jgi:hypothetical protein